ncbi:hypothetical protein [Pseudomonas piscis]|uniref:hypothetical protein n=1 Tax=Pseudomonas piscis TaxID=2614538 RepID=UPI0015B7454F|nr:hypothetical protein [Pseudomonas piscis]
MQLVQRLALVVGCTTSTPLHFPTGNSSREALFESFKVFLDGYTERQAYICYRSCPACNEFTTG